MHESLNSKLNLLQLPTPWRAVCFRDVGEVLADSGLERLRERADQGLGAELELHETEQQQARRGRTRAQFGPEAPSLNAELCRIVSSLNAMLLATARALGPASDAGKAVNEARERIFPQGVKALTSLSYVEFAVEIRHAFGESGEPTPADLHDLPGMPSTIARARALSKRFWDSLHAQREAVTHSDLQARREAGHARLCELVGLLWAQRVDSDPTSLKARAASSALDVIYRHEEAVRRSRRRAADRRARRATDAATELTAAQPSTQDPEANDPPEVDSRPRGRLLTSTLWPLADPPRAELSSLRRVRPPPRKQA